jgi:cytochrome c553
VKWMKTVRKVCGNLKKGIDAKDADAAAKDAKTLVGCFNTVGAFYSDRNTAVAAKDFDKAAASFKSLMGTCGACHKVHREKNEDGTFKIK